MIFKSVQKAMNRGWRVLNYTYTNYVFTDRGEKEREEERRFRYLNLLRSRLREECFPLHSHFPCAYDELIYDDDLDCREFATVTQVEKGVRESSVDIGIEGVRMCSKKQFTACKYSKVLK